MICPLKANIIIGTARADSMQSMVCSETVRCLSVCLSVCASMGPQQQTRYCRFAAVRPAGTRYRSIAAAAAGDAGSATLSSYVDS